MLDDVKVLLREAAEREQELLRQKAELEEQVCIIRTGTMQKIKKRFMG